MVSSLKLQKAKKRAGVWGHSCFCNPAKPLAIDFTLYSVKWARPHMDFDSAKHLRGNGGWK